MIDKIVEELRGIADGSITPPPDEGLCDHIRTRFDVQLLPFVLSRSEECQWPEFSGVLGFPVSGGELIPVGAFYSARGHKTLYAGEYGAARRRLAGYAADILEERGCLHDAT